MSPFMPWLKATIPVSVISSHWWKSTSMFCKAERLFKASAKLNNPSSVIWGPLEWVKKEQMRRVYCESLRVRSWRKLRFWRPLLRIDNALPVKLSPLIEKLFKYSQKKKYPSKLMFIFFNWVAWFNAPFRGSKHW